MTEDWNLTHTNMAAISKRHYEVAVIPIGATEPHNRHLPEGLDLLHTSHVAQQSCRLAWDKCSSVLCLPAIPYGVDCNLRSFPFAIHVTQKTLDAMLTDIISSLRGYGIRKFVIVNGHGGNDFVPLVRQIQCDMDVHVFICDWWLVARDRYDTIFDLKDDHAGQFETSVAMYLCPDLVEMENAGPGQTRPFRFEALEKGWVRTSRNFAGLNDHCAAGNPSGASAQKGKEYLDIVCERISSFLVQLAAEPIDKYFPMRDNTQP